MGSQGQREFSKDDEQFKGTNKTTIESITIDDAFVYTERDERVIDAIERQNNAVNENLVNEKGALQRDYSRALSAEKKGDDALMPRRSSKYKLLNTKSCLDNNPKSISENSSEYQSVQQKENEDTNHIKKATKHKKNGKKRKAPSHLSTIMKNFVERLSDGGCRCKECNKMFNKYVGIRQHVDAVHNEKHEIFECKDCGKDIRGKQRFRVHRNQCKYRKKTTS